MLGRVLRPASAVRPTGDAAFLVFRIGRHRQSTWASRPIIVFSIFITPSADRTYQIAALVQAVRIAPRAVPVKLFPPFHHACLAAVFLDEPAHLIAALAPAFPAFDAQHIEFAFDVAEDEVCSVARPYSITSSARARSDGGTVRPSAFAVLRLIARSYLVGACTGRSAGFSPLRMRSTYPAARRNPSNASGP